MKSGNCGTFCNNKCTGLSAVLLLQQCLLESFQIFTVLGETRKGKMVPWVVKSLRNKVSSLTASREDSERGRDSTITFTPGKNTRINQIEKNKTRAVSVYEITVTRYQQHYFNDSHLIPVIPLHILTLDES